MRNCTIETVTGDIVDFKGDAIVNAANNSLLGGGGVDGAIHSGAGPQLLEECRQHGGCPTGEARVTLGYNLEVKYIIHTVGPVWVGGDSGEQSLLGSCYFSCLKAAKELKITSIAFPAISCGVYGYPPKEAAAVAMESLKTYSATLNLSCKLTIVCFSRAMSATYNKILNLSHER
ncbi:MAG: macro domain-containing protein [Pseudomonadota bacterium]|nr:macro domain-containing protein [Pseudomonadota bacterium]